MAHCAGMLWELGLLLFILFWLWRIKQSEQNAENLVKVWPKTNGFIDLKSIYDSLENIKYKLRIIFLEFTFF